jgi:hypothetical protein
LQIMIEAAYVVAPNVARQRGGIDLRGRDESASAAPWV